MLRLALIFLLALAGPAMAHNTDTPQLLAQILRGGITPPREPTDKEMWEGNAALGRTRNGLAERAARGEAPKRPAPENPSKSLMRIIEDFEAAPPMGPRVPSLKGWGN